jgi:hypothetical protein
MSASAASNDRYRAGPLSLPGHPLAASVNRGNSRPRGLLLIAAVSVLRYRSSSRILGSQSPVAPLRTSHPSGSRPSVSSSPLVTPAPGREHRPQKTLSSSPCPYSSIAKRDRTTSWLRFERSNPMWLAARAQPHCKRAGWGWRAINSMVLPTRSRRCHRHPMIVNSRSGEGARPVIGDAFAHDVITRSR